MQARDRLLKEIEKLGSYNIMKVYDLVLSLKKQDRRSAGRKKQGGYLRARLALRNCKGSFSRDIIEERVDRV